MSHNLLKAVRSTNEIGHALEVLAMHSPRVLFLLLLLFLFMFLLLFVLLFVFVFLILNRTSICESTLQKCQSSSEKACRTHQRWQAVKGPPSSGYAAFKDEVFYRNRGCS